MSGGVRIPLPQAEPIAKGLVEFLSEACERIEIAGSIRRRTLDVGDIEIVAVPRTTHRVVPRGMFESEELVVNDLTSVLDAAIAAGVLAPHPEDPKRGERYSKLLHVASGLQVDIFSVLPPATWGVIFAIRTGPAEFSQWLVTIAKKRFHVVDGALHRGGVMGCGALPCEIEPTPEEGDFFRALGIAWRPASMREGHWR